MSRYRIFIFLVGLLSVTVKRSNAIVDSSLLSYYDFKVTNSEATCRLVNHANLPEDRRTLAGRDCMCDEECVLYKDCCKDSRYYRPSEQSQPPSHICSETTGVYMTTICSPNWKDNKMARDCQRSVEPSDSDDLSLILPVANQKTRKVYGNYHCAVCNNDLDQDSWIQFSMGVACGEAPQGFLKYDPGYILSPPTNKFGFPNEKNQHLYDVHETNIVGNNDYNGTSSSTRITNNYVVTQPSPGFILDINLYITNDSVIGSRGNILQQPIQLQTVVPTEWRENSFDVYGRKKRNSKYEIDFQRYSAQAQKICSTAKYDANNKEFVSRYDNKYFICRFGAILPENSSNFTRRCVPFLERQCPNDFEDETIKEECAIHTKIVYNKINKKPYRNKDCARCNGEKEDTVDGTPQNTRTDLSGLPSAVDKSGGVDHMLNSNKDFKPVAEGR